MKYLIQFTCLFSILLGLTPACHPNAEKPQAETLPVHPMHSNSIDDSRLQNFGKKYAAAWCSQKPETVAALFAVDGSLKVNDAAPAVGREAITKVAQGFMTAFPDMVVAMDSVVPTDLGADFHWTLMGTNTGPQGTGKRVHIHGVELWQFNSEGLISQSLGSFDANEYNRQLKFGANN